MKRFIIEIYFKNVIFDVKNSDHKYLKELKRNVNKEIHLKFVHKIKALKEMVEEIKNITQKKILNDAFEYLLKNNIII
jgi:hypothetical protein